MAENKEKVNSLLIKVKKESEKAGLKFNTQKTKLMVAGFITSGQTDREIVMNFIFLGSKTTTDIDCSHEIKRTLILGRKAMTNIDSILKSRNIAFPLKVRVVKGAVFLVVMYRCESSSLKKIEH